ncbi:MAG: hypothetical protein GXW99_07370 [Clostridiales bacterium]|nr:hypothetical protein [Clostridiales bacterium]
MDNLLFTPGDPQEEAPARRVQKKKRKLPVIVLSIVLGAAVILAAVFWNSPTFDAIRRAITYRTTKTDKGNLTEIYRYNSDKSNCFADMGDGLLVASNTAVNLYARGGETIYTQSVKFTQAAVTQSDKLAVAYDIGGMELYVFDTKGLLGTITTEGKQAILSATVNDAGYLAVTANKSGYKAAVYVYNPERKLVFEFDSADRFVMTACVSADGKYVAAATMGQTEGSFLTNTVIYRITSTEPDAQYGATGGLVYQMGLLDGTFCEVAEDRLDTIDDAGKLIASYSFDGGYLRGCSLQGNGFAALLLDRYKSGSQGRLVTVDKRGEEIGSLDINEEVLHISAAGSYVSVLFADHLVIYDKNLKQCANLEDISSAKYALVRSDGSALLTGSAAANLYLP